MAEDINFVQDMLEKYGSDIIAEEPSEQTEDRD